MENSMKLKLFNGLASAMLLAPIVGTTTSVVAQEADSSEVTTQTDVIYSNDFEEGNYPDSVAVPAGDAVLNQADDITTAGGDIHSGVWVTNRVNAYDGIDLPFIAAGIEDGKTYSVTVQGYILADEEIPEGALVTLETVDGYTWLNNVPAVAGETFELTADYAAIAENDKAFRIKTNDNGVGMEFAVTDISITAQAAEDETPAPEEDAELDTLYRETFNDGITQAAGASVERQADFNNGQGALYVSGRTANWNGVDVPFEAAGMELGYTYEVTVTGHVDEDVEIPEGAQAFLQSPDDDYPFFAAADFTAGEEFTLEHSFTWDNEAYENFRVQSNDEGAEVPFYITEIAIEWNPDQTPVEEEPDPTPDPDLPAAEEFAFVEFEDNTLNGFAARGDNEIIEVTDAENHTDAGQYSLFTSNRDMAWNGPALRVENYINSGSEYQVSAWVKTDSETSTEFRLSTQVAEGDAASYNTIDSASISAADGWVQLEGTYRYTSLGGGFVTIYVETANGLVDFYIDDIDFQELDSEEIDVQLDLAQIKEVYEDDFLIGNAVSMGDLEGPRLDLLNHHHNLVTAENAMKPSYAYGDDGSFDFTGSNELVERVAEEGLLLHGHVLVWHQQSPEWLHSREDGTPLSRDEALDNMQAHIRNAMENYDAVYGDGVISWDVVNEALDGDWSNPEDWRGQLRDSGWLRAIGEDYIYEAFKYAREVADELGREDLVLFYNDYNDDQQSKAIAMYSMIKEINEQYADENPDDTRKLISGVGMQAHYNANTNPENVRLSIERFIELDIEIGVTELDVTTLTPNETIESELERQAYLYASLFQIYDEYSDHISRVTFWGLNDTNSWRSDRSPLLFNDTLTAKQAYYAVVDPEGFLEGYEEEEVVADSDYAVYGTPEINAEADEIWESAPELDVSRYQSAWQGATGHGRVLWDENNLYILVEVSDGDLDISAVNPWEQDSVEVFVNETGEETSTYIDGVGQYRVNYENDASFNPAAYSEGFVSAARVTNGGYVVEMAIPWKGVTPESGHTLGFDIQVNDGEEGSRVSAATWNDMTGQGFQDPSVFGFLTLVKDLDEIGEEPVEPGEDETAETPGDEGDETDKEDETDEDSDKDTDDESAQDEEDEEGEKLPQTATATWAVGLLGLAGLLSGLSLRFIRRQK
ncbi:endo-1,4-beta-xylanase [Alkalibacterium subtropicum]|uniref:Beta-xylanase n=1 Tax=Alkalibacterium subtropicum TaxID=753702 RepID=A0A1I1LPB9_9LACT|nr:endo-1,4-beta-xylanase [Alkalibacterium subtropicum]SFC74402.1 endo-1,4-beta-xylanase [Alkalibacterium subtropicum]